jgi:hypothetical protein
MIRALRLYTSFRIFADTLEFRQHKEAEIISEILLKAASEPEFRNELIKDPAVVLENYNISPEAKLIITRSIIDLTQ